MRVARILAQEKDMTKFKSFVMEFFHSDVPDTSEEENAEIANTSLFQDSV